MDEGIEVNVITHTLRVRSDSSVLQELMEIKKLMGPELFCKKTGLRTADFEAYKIGCDYCFPLYFLENLNTM